LIDGSGCWNRRYEFLFSQGGNGRPYAVSKSDNQIKRERNKQMNRCSKTKDLTLNNKYTGNETCSLILVFRFS
jgi:hypothetical protein